MTSHGGRAVQAGQILEGVVRSTLEGNRAHGFQVITNADHELAACRT